MKPIAFVGTTLDELREFPPGARRDSGRQLDRVQRGLDPVDWKPMASIGQGVREMRIRDDAGAFRVVYVATLVDAVYVLHALQKKMEKIARGDLGLAGQRLRALMQDKEARDGR